MGTVSGTFKQHPDAALIWVDAHAVSPALETSSRSKLTGARSSFLIFD